MLVDVEAGSEKQNGRLCLLVDFTVAFAFTFFALLLCTGNTMWTLAACILEASPEGDKRWGGEQWKSLETFAGVLDDTTCVRRWSRRRFGPFACALLVALARNGAD